MANLLICDQCRNMWSISFAKMDSLLLLRLAWCPMCRVRNRLVPIGNVPGVNKPPIHFGPSPPPEPPPAKVPLLLTYESHNPGGGGTAIVVQPAVQRPGPTNVLPAGTGMIVGHMSDEAATTAFRNHIQGQPIPYPPDAILKKYFSSSADKLALEAADYHGTNPSKIYARMIAIHAIEMGLNLKMEVPAPKGETYTGATHLRRDLTGTLLRIAKGEPTAKTSTMPAITTTALSVATRSSRTAMAKATRVQRPAQSTCPHPRSFQVCPASTGSTTWAATRARRKPDLDRRRPGAERLFLQVPDYIFYTWNH